MDISDLEYLNHQPPNVPRAGLLQGSLAQHLFLDDFADIDIDIDLDNYGDGHDVDHDVDHDHDYDLDHDYDPDYDEYFVDPANAAAASIFGDESASTLSQADADADTDTDAASSDSPHDHSSFTSTSAASSAAHHFDPDLTSSVDRGLAPAQLPRLHPQPFLEDPFEDTFHSRLRRINESGTSSSSGLSLPRLEPLRQRLDRHPYDRADHHSPRQPLEQQQTTTEQPERPAAERPTQSSLAETARIRRQNDILDHLDNSFDQLIEMEVESRRRRSRLSLQVVDAPSEQNVIDLTLEPDSPVQNHRPLPRPGLASSSSDVGPASRNPRRHLSQRRQTPSFTRSDGSLLGGGASAGGAAVAAGAGQASVIDLTQDSPDEARHTSQIRSHRSQEQPRREPAEADLAIVGMFARLNEDIGAIGRLFGFLPGVNRQRRNPHLPADIEVQFIGQNQGPFAAPMDNPLAGNPVQFNYQARGFGNPQPPKPPHVPPPPPRDGFTRDTAADQVVICPSCAEELKYDPEDAHDDEGPPTKKVRTKKDREEHHFWAVPTCGHVFCRKCYENRRNCLPKKGKAAEKVDAWSVGFRPGHKPNQILCAVEDCESEVSTKSKWVGIFL